MVESGYDVFAESLTRRQWNTLGTVRRAGVNTPLFSLYSDASTGIGDILDLELLIDWCAKTGQSIIQLLPLNDVGYQFCPYDAQSTFALEPVYLNLQSLRGVDIGHWQKEIDELRRLFPCGRERIDYGIKRAKMDLLQKIYHAQKGVFSEEFTAFREKHSYWLRDYGLYRVLKHKFSEASWMDWPEPFRRHEEEALAELFLETKSEHFFYLWLQWQLFEQMSRVKAYGAGKGVHLMGDLPFLVSRDSADVWAHQNYFKMDRESGAPPDAYIAEGQRWGMPPYDWSAIAADGYSYLKNKVCFAENFYSLFRIDHVVGLFRLWTIASQEPYETGGRNGAFDPEDESLWEEHGRNLLRIMCEASAMLPCAEDLGVVPDCAYKVLSEMSIPGMEIQRWTRDWDGSGEFLQPETYRACSVTMVSTHDMPHFLGWWLCEVGTVRPELLDEVCAAQGVDAARLKKELFTDQGPVLRWKFESLSREAVEAAAENSEVAKVLLEQYDHSRQEYDRYLSFLELSPADAASPRKAVYQALLKASQTRSIFAIQFIQDWLALAGFFHEDPFRSRMNAPGTVGNENWSLVMPLSLNRMLELKENQQILEINRSGERL